MSTPDVDLFDDLREVRRQFPMPPMAFSPGGRHGRVVGPLGGGVTLGDLVVIERDDALPLVGQVQSLELAQRAAAEIQTTMGVPLADGGQITSARSTPLLRFVAGDLLLLGTLDGDQLTPDLPAGGFEEHLYRTATDDERRTIRAALGRGDANLTVGSVVGATDVPSNLRAKGFARHTFLCGQSGSGKTYAMGVVLERLQLATELPMVIFDPNSDHVHPGELPPGAEDDPDADAYRALHPHLLVARSRRHDPERLLAIHFSDLPTAVQATLLGLDPVADLDDHAAFRTAKLTLGPQYEVGDVATAALAIGTEPGRALATRIENLAIGDWGIWCRPGEPSLVDQEPLKSRCLVLDLGSLDLPAERTLVAAATLQWLWGRREERRPVLIVVDEAHNVFPAESHSTLAAITTELGVAIAAEGRKYGLHLLVATQRPSRVHENVVSQCDNLALLRVNSVTDVDDLCRLFSHVPPGLIRQAPDFQLGEVLFAGPISDLPTRTKIGRRLSPEGGGDLPTDWAAPRP